MNRTDDRRLIARLQARDQAAVHDLAQRYGQRIYQLALRQMKNREDAEEVRQDVLMKVYRKIGAFRGDSALSSWIYRITFNTAMSRLRTSKLARQAQQQEHNRDEDDKLRALREPAGELQCERRHPRCSSLVDLGPVITRSVIVGMKAGEEIHCRHPPVEERRIVAAPGARPFLLDVEHADALRSSEEIALHVVLPVRLVEAAHVDAAV